MRFPLSPVALFGVVLLPLTAQGQWEEADVDPADGSEPGSEVAGEPSPSDSAGDEGSRSAAAASDANAGEAESEPPPRSGDPEGTTAERTVKADAVIVVKTEEPAPLEKTTRRLHDGFYLRGSIGNGWFGSKFSSGLLDDATVGGGSGVLDVQLGGTPARGLVIGGGLFLTGMEHEDVRPPNVPSARGDDPGAIGLVAVGPFIDYFPDPKEGFHFGGMLGVAALGFDTPADVGDDPYYADDERVGTGGALGAWVGYDWWVAREWSLGVQLRYLGAVVENETYDWRGAADTLSLQFTVLYH